MRLQIMSNNFLSIKELRKLIQEVVKEVEGENPELIDPDGGKVFHIDDDGNIVYHGEEESD